MGVSAAWIRGVFKQGGDMAERPLNTCGLCRNTWYPRGKDRSSKCPRCSSAEVHVVVPPVAPAVAPSVVPRAKKRGGGLYALLIVGAVVFFLVSQDKPKDASLYAPGQESSAKKEEFLEPTPSVGTAFLPTREPQSPSQEVVQSSDSSAWFDGKFPDPDSTARAQPTPAISPARVLSTPTSICAHEASIFSRNNCEWRECEKPEFAALEECRHKRRKEDSFGG